MAFVPVPNVAHIVLVGETDGQETDNDLYFVSTAPPITALSLATLTDTVSGWYGANIRPQLADIWFYSHARGRDLTSQNSFVAVSVDGSGAGAVGTEQAPSNVTTNVTFGTGLAGRNNHGSNRIPAIPNAVIDTNTFINPFLPDILDAYDLLLAPSLTLPGGWTWVVVSQFSGSTLIDGKKVPTPRAEGIFHEIFDVYFVDDLVDSQKTRLPKHGK